MKVQLRPSRFVSPYWMVMIMVVALFWGMLRDRVERGHPLRGRVWWQVAGLAVWAGLVLTAALARRVLGASPFPGAASLAAVAAGVLLHLLLDAWSPEGWWVFVYGAGVIAPVWAILYVGCVRPLGSVVGSAA